MANKGLGWDSLLKVECHLGGGWHPGYGVDPTDHFFHGRVYQTNFPRPNKN